MKFILYALIFTVKQLQNPKIASYDLKTENLFNAFKNPLHSTIQYFQSWNPPNSVTNLNRENWKDRPPKLPSEQMAELTKVKKKQKNDVMAISEVEIVSNFL